MAPGIFVTFNADTPELASQVIIQLAFLVPRVFVRELPLLVAREYCHLVDEFPTLLHEYSIRVYINEPIDEEEKSTLTFCEYLSGCDAKDLLGRVSAILRRVNMLQQSGSVVVFDLDDVLIDEKDQLLDSTVLPVLHACSTWFTYCVLWSHGTSRHVADAFRRHKLGTFFHMTLSKDVLRSKLPDTTKGMGYVLRCLNQKFGLTRVIHSCLVDDQRSNFNDDYDQFILVDAKRASLGSHLKFIKDSLEHAQARYS